MKILLDENIPWELRHYLPGHDVRTAHYTRWDGKVNGELLTLAREEFDVLITMDHSIPSQRNLSETDVAVVVLRAPSNSIEHLRPLVPILVGRLHAVEHGHTYYVTS